jgi:hypothetical protein
VVFYVVNIRFWRCHLPIEARNKKVCQAGLGLILKPLKRPNAAPPITHYRASQRHPKRSYPGLCNYMACRAVIGC